MALMTLPLSPYLSTIRAVKIRYMGYGCQRPPLHHLLATHFPPPNLPQQKISQQIFKERGETGPSF